MLPEIHMQRSDSLLRLSLLLGPLALAACSLGRAPDPGASPPPAGERDDDAMESYAEVITDEAVSDDGLFAVH